MHIPVQTVRKYVEEMKDEYKFPDEPAVIEYEVKPTLGGNGLRAQDYLILNIIHANNWRRPIYFALTVSEGNKVGLNDHMRLDGMSWKLVPYKDMDVSPSILSKNLLEKFKYRNLSDPDVYYDQQAKDLLQNIRTMFLQLTFYYYKKGDKINTVETMDKMEEILPASVIPVKHRDIDIQIGRLYAQSGRPEELEKRLDKHTKDPSLGHEKLFEFGVLYKSSLNNTQKAIETIKKVIDQQKDFVKAYSFLLAIYEQEKMYKEGKNLLEQWITINPNDDNARKRILELEKSIAASDSVK
jgi:tetratricopeptide (TPR) repeat protein